MNGRITDGGPAFPATEYFDEKPIGLYSGMTLRDWFAGQALIGLISAVDIKYPKLTGYASRAYEVADAMLEQREK